jgi:hypothetical protein
MTIDFKFEIDRKVKVEKLGITGIVSLCGYDDDGVKYYIDSPSRGGWFKETLLTDAEAEE